MKKVMETNLGGGGILTKKNADVQTLFFVTFGAHYVSTLCE